MKNGPNSDTATDDLQSHTPEMGYQPIIWQTFAETDCMKTRQHSSRMHTTHLKTVCASVLVATSRCHSQGEVGPRSDVRVRDWGRYPTMWPIPCCM